MAAAPLVYGFGFYGLCPLLAVCRLCVVVLSCFYVVRLLCCYVVVLSVCSVAVFSLVIKKMPILQIDILC